MVGDGSNKLPTVCAVGVGTSLLKAENVALIFLFFVRGGTPVYLMHHFIFFHIGMEFNHWDLFYSTYFFLLEFRTLFLWISGRNGLYHVRSSLSRAAHKYSPHLLLFILKFEVEVITCTGILFL